jgi:hypothetical protein
LRFAAGAANSIRGESLSAAALAGSTGQRRDMIEEMACAFGQRWVIKVAKDE